MCASPLLLSQLLWHCLLVCVSVKPLYHLVGLLSLETCQSGRHVEIGVSKYNLRCVGISRAKHLDGCHVITESVQFVC